MRNLSPVAVASMMAQETGEVWLVLLTIEHGALSEPIRVVNNLEDIASNGNNFIGCPFEIELPGQDTQRASAARLRIDNVDREIVNSVRAITTPAEVTIQIILASQPDTIEVQYDGLVLRNVQWDGAFVTGDLVAEDIFSEPICTMMTPSAFPGLF